MRILLCDVECILKDTRYPLKDTFEDLGHRVDVFDWSYYFPRGSYPGVFYRINSRLFESLYISKINKDLCSVVKKARYDLVLVLMGRYFYPESVIELKRSVGCVVNWHSDDPFNRANSSRFLMQALPFYDMHFTPRPHLIPEYKKLGVSSIYPLGWYYRPSLIFSETSVLPSSYKFGISFVGSWSRYRENYLSKVFHLGGSVFGWGWKTHYSGTFRNYREHAHPAVSLTEMHDIFHNSAININILTRENRDVTNLRNFEIAAAMGFQLAERSDEVLRCFDEDTEIVCFSTVEELVDKCTFYLNNESPRRNIAMAGFRRVLRSDYTLSSRLKNIISKVRERLQ